MYKERFYLVYYDRETDFKNITYKFYVSTSKGKFKEIKAIEFSKHIAIQNWFWSINSHPERLEGLVPEKIVGTTTAFIWRMIEDYPKTFDSFRFCKRLQTKIYN